MPKAAMLLCFLVSSLISSAQVDSSLSLELSRALQALSEEDKLVGFAVVTYDEEGILYEGAFGYADRKEEVPYRTETVQNIASISKTFIGIALLKAQELGYLHLDDPINKYLPFEVLNPFHPDDVITIRQITSHTSSIQDRGWWYGFNSYVLKEKKKPGEKKKIYFSSSDKMLTLEELYYNYLSKDGKSYKKKSFTKSRPGDEYKYSNIAAALGAYILEEATGQDFKAFTQEHIFDPLQMNDTGWAFDDIDMSKHSKVYTASKKPIAFYSLVTYPDGGLRSSANDMAKYASELILGHMGKGTILSQRSFEEAYTGALTDEQVASRGYDDYGVFFEITEKSKIGHGGSDPGVTTLMYFDPDSKKGSYLQVNTEVTKKNSQNFIDIWRKLIEYQEKYMR